MHAWAEMCSSSTTKGSELSSRQMGEQPEATRRLSVARLGGERGARPWAQKKSCDVSLVMYAVSRDLGLTKPSSKCDICGSEGLSNRIFGRLFVRHRISVRFQAHTLTEAEDGDDGRGRRAHALSSS